MKLQNDKWKIFVVMAVSFALLTGQPSVVSAAEGQASAGETTQEERPGWPNHRGRGRKGGGGRQDGDGNQAVFIGISRLRI